jgi:hypothetical protein
MRKIVFILMVLTLPFLQGCYIQRYFNIKKEYEAFHKDLGKVRGVNSRLLAQRQTKLDSIHLVESNSKALRIGMIRADSMTELYTIQILKALGKDPWGDSVKKAANTAANTEYMSGNEKQVIYWLNIARMQPDLFAEMNLKPYLQLYDDDEWICCGEGAWGMETHVTYVNTCYLKMAKMDSLKALMPDENNYKSAECHATQSGITGYVGHERTNCQEHFSGECCDYGNEDPLGVILDLLVDAGVPSLGHRRICLGGYSGIGVSQKPHKGYRVNVVLDFD